MRHSSQTAQFMIRNALRRHADKTALVIGAERWRYCELDDLSTRLAAQLRARGLRRGDRLALLLRNGVEFVVADLAIFRRRGQGAANEMLHERREP